MACNTCGLLGSHKTTADCIAALSRELAAVKTQAEAGLNRVLSEAHQARLTAVDANEKADRLRKEFDKHTAQGKGSDHVAIE